jgi:predicted metal-dependent phosphotriesterase family hydrolase
MSSRTVKNPSVRTVLGDIAPSELGRLDYHEHLFQVTPLLAGDELDDERASGEEARLLLNAGIESMIEATPIGLGQRPHAVARVSQASGLHIIHTTGAHHGGHYPEGHWVRSLTEDELFERFRVDIESGFDSAVGDEPGAARPLTQPVRAGMVKAGVQYWKIGDFERRVLAAVGRTHVATGAPVMVHLDYGSAALEVLAILESHGVDPSSVVLAHIDRNLDAGFHIELADRGAYLGYDGMARHREAPDSAIIDCILRVVEAGRADRVLLGGDVARRSRYVSYGGIPGLAYLPERFIPRLERSVGPEALSCALINNPARLLAF